MLTNFPDPAHPHPGSDFPTGVDISAVLQNLVLESDAVTDFLSKLASLTVDHFSAAGSEVLCGITLLRPKKASTVASSSAKAQRMDEIQYAFGDGPCMTAARTLSTVYVADVRQESERWPQYSTAIAGHGLLSILAVPVALDGEASCAINLYSATVDGFSTGAVQAATTFARDASSALRLAVRIAHLTETGENLKAALESRTTIDLAAGIVMGQNKCGHDEAMAILKAASSARNIKIRELAATVVTSLGQPHPRTHFQE